MEQHEPQLEWERRFGRLAAGAAVASLLLGLGAQVFQAQTSTRRGGDRAALLKLQDHATDAITGTVAQSLSVVFLALAMLYLLRCTRYRRPERILGTVVPLVVLAPVLFTVGALIFQLDIIDIAETFVDSGARTEQRANELLDEVSQLPRGILQAGLISLGFSLAILSLNALRAGLMTRFIGILGIITGVLYVVPILTGPFIIQMFWLGALTAIFLGRWPGGRGEAWETGEAGVWLSAAEQRRQAIQESRLQESAEAEAEAEADEPAPEPEEGPHPVSRKRRRKRRR